MDKAGSVSNAIFSQVSAACRGCPASRLESCSFGATAAVATEVSVWAGCGVDDECCGSDQLETQSNDLGFGVKTEHRKNADSEANLASNESLKTQIDDLACSAATAVVDMRVATVVWARKGA